MNWFKQLFGSKGTESAKQEPVESAKQEPAESAKQEPSDRIILFLGCYSKNLLQSFKRTTADAPSRLVAVSDPTTVRNIIDIKAYFTVAVLLLEMDPPSYVGTDPHKLDRWAQAVLGNCNTRQAETDCYAATDTGREILKLTWKGVSGADICSTAIELMCSVASNGGNM